MNTVNFFLSLFFSLGISIYLVDIRLVPNSCLHRFTTYMMPSHILNIVLFSVGVMSKFRNPELNEFLAPFASPETLIPLTRCQVEHLKSLLRSEVDSYPRFESFVAKNESLPVIIEFSSGDADSLVSDGEPEDVNEYIQNIDAHIQAMLDAFFGPAGDDSCMGA
jgi:hypothetical protein